MEKMQTGLEYCYDDEEISLMKLRAIENANIFNSLDEDDLEKQHEVLSEILGAAPAPEMPSMPEVPAPEMPGLTGSDEAAPAEDTAPAMEVTQPLNVQPGRAMYGDPDMDRVKISALTDIRPILEKIEGISPERKFMVYRDIIELTDDKSCLEAAYNAAAKMSDDKERADALLFIIETVDKLGVKMPVEDK